MTLSSQLSRHFKEVYFGGNWTWSNLKDVLSDVSYSQATTKVGNLNTILALAYHINYYVKGIRAVFEGGPLEAKDKFSFNHPAIRSSAEWQHFLDGIFQDGEALVALIAEWPADQWRQTFADEKYGSYMRNIQGLIEHTHYHLGQIVLIKKLLDEGKPNKGLF